MLNVQLLFQHPDSHRCSHESPHHPGCHCFLVTVVSWSAGPGLGDGRCSSRCGGAHAWRSGENWPPELSEGWRSLRVTRTRRRKKGAPSRTEEPRSEPSRGARPHPQGGPPLPAPASRGTDPAPLPSAGADAAARAAPLLASGFRGLVGVGQLTHKLKEVQRQLCPGLGARAPRPRDGNLRSAGSRRPQ